MFCPSMSKIKISVRILMPSLDGGREGRRVEGNRVNLAENKLIWAKSTLFYFLFPPSLQSKRTIDYPE